MDKNPKKWTKRHATATGVPKKKIKYPIPERFKKFLVLIASCQDMEKLPPVELYMNIKAYLQEERGYKCLEIDKKEKLRAYINAWNLQDFTREVNNA